MKFTNCFPRGAGCREGWTRRAMPTPRVHQTRPSIGFYLILSHPTSWPSSGLHLFHQFSQLHKMLQLQSRQHRLANLSPRFQQTKVTAAATATATIVSGRTPLCVCHILLFLFAKPSLGAPSRSVFIFYHFISVASRVSSWFNNSPTASIQPPPCSL